MNIQENSRIEYRARINRVMDYIDRHLDWPMLQISLHFISIGFSLS